MFDIFQVLLTTSLVLCVQSHVIWEAPNNLHPVHGLYVKPSVDGTTGDLYVAATEDNGVKSQWLTDQPINFLPASSGSSKIAPVSLTSSLMKTTSPKEETITMKKQAVVTSPPVKYAYALPIPGIDGNIPQFHHVIPTSPTKDPSMIPSCSTDISAPPYPFNYFYPHLMSAIASVINSYKENNASEETIPVTAPIPYFPQSFGYPYQYVIIDPSTWAENQNNASPSDTSTAISEEES